MGADSSPATCLPAAHLASTHEAAVRTSLTAARYDSFRYAAPPTLCSICKFWEVQLPLLWIMIDRQVRGT